MKLHWSWVALTFFTIALVLGGPANDTGALPHITMLTQSLYNFAMQILRSAVTKYKAWSNNSEKITDDLGSRTGKFLNLFSVIRSVSHLLTIQSYSWKNEFTHRLLSHCQPFLHLQIVFTSPNSFSNTPCVGTSGIEQRNGTCYTEKECKQRNGVGVGEYYSTPMLRWCCWLRW